MALAKENPIDIDSLVSARIYDGEPTSTQRADHTGALADYLQKKTTLTSSGDSVYSVAFDAIEDEDPDDTDLSERYWVVFSLTLESAGETQTVVEPLTVWRLDVVSSICALEPADLIAVDSIVGKLRSSSDLRKHIENAERTILRRLKGRGYRRGQILEEDMLDAAKSLSLAYAWRDIGDAQKYETYKAEFNEVFELQPIEKDTNADGAVDESDISTVGSGPLYVGR